jgi:putative transposase
MPWGLKRYQQAGPLHFIMFSCYHRWPLLGTPGERDCVVKALEDCRVWYGFCVVGYVVMPEHVHLLVTEPERCRLALALRMLKHTVSRRVEVKVRGRPFWQARYYDFNVWSEGKWLEKLGYIHDNPVKRGLVQRAEDWQWSSARHYLTGEEGVVEIESHWTARKRERMGIRPRLKRSEPA